MDKIEYGFKAYTGVKFTDGQVDTYNALTERIQSFKNAGMKVPEYLLNGRHNFFQACATK